MRVANLLATKGHDVATISQERTVTDALALLEGARHRRARRDRRDARPSRASSPSATSCAPWPTRGAAALDDDASPT